MPQPILKSDILNIEDLKVGVKLQGTVRNVVDFGAFVDIEGGKNGLIHISEISDVYVRDVHDFLSEGDKVQAKIISIDERGKIALSLKQMKKQSQESERENHSRGKSTRNEQRIERGENRRPIKQGPASFEDKLSKFMKESDEKLADWKKKTDSKRGGRGSRRSD